MNRLAGETSPYLRQHSNNPVDWRPWGDEAFAEARARDVPVFLSVGYSTCHWCHVMEEESFEDLEIAEVLNRLFVPIKVDREERPDVDSIYMQAVQLLTQHGGWPMSVFLTPERKPFYGGTYFPPRDGVHGGVRRAPKFPSSLHIRFLLRYARRTGDEQALEMARLTLTRMALGGIYDQVGGGFHRYSTDARWLVPHFEKMLYDNALLTRLYLHAYQATGEEFFSRVAEETLGYVKREMTDESGAFYSTQDADSEGVEGKFFVWDKEEVENLLGPSDGPLFCAYYDVTVDGNFEGRNILHVEKSIDEVAREQN